MQETYHGDAEKCKETDEDPSLDRHLVRTSGRPPVDPVLQVPEPTFNLISRTVQFDGLLSCQRTVRQEHE